MDFSLDYKYVKISQEILESWGVIMKEKLNAVHDDDLKDFLESLEIYSKFTAGKFECKFCKSVITCENLHSIFPESGSIKFTCSKPECVKKLIEKVGKIKND